MRVLALLAIVACGSSPSDQAKAEAEAAAKHAREMVDAGVDAATRIAVDAAAPVEVAVPAPKRPPPIGVASLPAIPLLPRPPKGDPVDLLVANESIDRVLAVVGGDRPFLMPPIGTSFSGRIKGSRAAAFDAIIAHHKIKLTAPVLRGGGPQVDFVFAEAPVHDLLQIIGDVMRTNVVDDGDLPKLDIGVRRAPANALLELLAKMSGKRVIRQGGVIYVVAPDRGVPAIPPISSRDQVELAVAFGTAADAAAALAAATGATLRTPCGGALIALRVRRLSTAEAARSIAVAAHARFEGTGCPITESRSPDLAGARLLATAQAGTRTAAVIAHGDTRELVLGGGGVEIRSGAITVGKTTLQFPTPWQRADDRQPAAAYLSTLVRTSLIARGRHTFALVHTTANTTVTIDEHSLDLPESIRATNPTIDERGVTFTLPPDDPRGTPTTVLVPLAN